MNTITQMTTTNTLVYSPSRLARVVRLAPPGPCSTIDAQASHILQSRVSFFTAWDKLRTVRPAWEMIVRIGASKRAQALIVSNLVSKINTIGSLPG